MTRHGVLALLVAYTMLRAALLLGHFDEVAMPPFELGVMGNLARLASEGDIVLPFYLYFDNVGGHLVVGLLAAPLYWLLGDSYLALKLVPLGLGMGSLLLLIRLLDRLAGARAAWIGGLLFTFAPPTLLKYSVLAKGNHFEGLFFQLLAYAVFCRAQESTRRPGWLFAAGLTAGFACFFYIGSLVLVAGMLATHLLLVGGRQALRDARWAVPGYATGLLPLVWIGFAPDGRLLGFLGAKLGALDGGAAGRFGERVLHLFTDILPRAGAWTAVGPVPSQVPEWLFLGVFVLAWATSVRPILGAARLARCEGATVDRSKPLLLLPALLYLPLFAIAFGASTFDFDPYSAPVEVGQFRYLTPHFLFAIVLIAAALGRWRGSRPRVALRRLALGATGVAAGLALSLLGGRSIEASAPSAYAGSHFPYLANLLFKESELDAQTGARAWDYADIAERVQALPDGPRHGAAFGAGHHMAWIAITPAVRGEDHGVELALGPLLGHYPPEDAIDVARGVGSHLRRIFAGGGSGPERARRALADLGVEDHRMLPYVIEGLSCDFGYPLGLVTDRDIDVSRALRELVPPDLQPAWWRGFGRQCGQLVARGLKADVERARAEGLRVPVEAEREFWRGFGLGVAEEAQDDARACSLAELLTREPPVARRELASEGFGWGLRHRLGAEGAARALAVCRAGLAPRRIRAMESGAAWPGYPGPPGYPGSFETPGQPGLRAPSESNAPPGLRGSALAGGGPNLAASE